MGASDVLAIATIVIVAIFVGALATALVSVTRTLRVLRTTVEGLRDEMLPLAAELRDAARDASDEVERVDRLVSSAERLEDAVDSAGRFAYRTFANPVVKAMAVGTGVSRAAQRLRSNDSTATAATAASTATVRAAAQEATTERRRRGRRAS